MKRFSRCYRPVQRGWSQLSSAAPTSHRHSTLVTTIPLRKRRECCGMGDGTGDVDDATSAKSQLRRDGGMLAMRTALGHHK